ncbi:MAG TPA: macro domain-containing protein, partial [Stenomitos sp.]
LALAEQYEIRTLAFPAISTGVYGFPVKRAAKIAVKQVKTFLENPSSVEAVIFVCFNRQTYDAYRSAVQEILLSNEQG